MQTLTPTERRYDATRAQVVEVIDEVVVGDVVVGLFRVRTNQRGFLVMTSGGGSSRMGRNAEAARREFERWVAASR
jgi:hypothetical protein